MPYSQLLAPWEYTEDLPSVIESGEFIHKERFIRFELLRAQLPFQRLVFRDEKDDGTWTSSAWRDHTSLASIHEQLKIDLEDRPGGRMFWMGSEQLIIRSNGVGNWGPGGPVQERNSYFSLGRRVSKLTSSQTYEWILKLCSRPSSDISFAHRFSQATKEQKEAQVFGFASEVEWRQAWSHVEALCQLVLFSEVELWQREYHIGWGLLRPKQHHHARFWISGEQYRYPFTPRLDLWARVIEELGGLRPQFSRMCLREFFYTNPRFAGGQLSAPSAHEQLEARLELREWSQKNLPPGIEAELWHQESK